MKMTIYGITIIASDEGPGIARYAESDGRWLYNFRWTWSGNARGPNDLWMSLMSDTEQGVGTTITAVNGSLKG